MLLRQNQVFRLLILLLLIGFWREDLNLVPFKVKSFWCLVFRPLTRLRHILKLVAFISLRKRSITASSDSPNWWLMASKGVRSSQAISIILSFCSSLNDSITNSNAVGTSLVHAIVIVDTPAAPLPSGIKPGGIKVEKP